MPNPAAREHYVYILYREDGVTPFYVGIGKGKRWLSHEREAHRRKSYKDAIIRSIHAKGLELIKRKVAEGFTREQACALEISLIRAIGRKPHGPLANCTGGGEGHYDPLPSARAAFVKNGQMHRGRKRTPETLARKSEVTRKQMASPQARARVSAALKGHGFSDEAIAKMRATRSTPEYRKAMSDHFKALHADPEYKSRLYAKLTGRKRSEESKLKMSLAKKGKKMSDEARRNMVAAQKKRRELERGADSGQ